MCFVDAMYQYVAKRCSLNIIPVIFGFHGTGRRRCCQQKTLYAEDVSYRRRIIQKTYHAEDVSYRRCIIQKMYHTEDVSCRIHCMQKTLHATSLRSEYLLQLGITHLSNPIFTRSHGHLGEITLLPDHLIDLFLKRITTD